MAKAIIESSVGLVLIFSFLVTFFSGVFSVVLRLINNFDLYFPCRVIFMRSTAVMLLAVAAYLLIIGVYEEIEWRDVNGADLYKMVASSLLAVFLATMAIAIYKMI